MSTQKGSVGEFLNAGLTGLMEPPILRAETQTADRYFAITYGKKIDFFKRAARGAANWPRPGWMRWDISLFVLILLLWSFMGEKARAVIDDRQSSRDPIVTSAGTSSSTDPNATVQPGASQAQVQAASLKQEAVATARQVAEAYPQEALTYALLGSAYYNTGKSDEATKYLQKCLELRPEQADAYEILSRIAFEKGNLEESVRLCREGLKRGPPNPEMLNQLGKALMDLGRTEEAKETLQQAIRLPDASSQSFYLLGQANLQSGNFAEGKASFQKAIALLPDHTQAFFGLYRACLGLGETAEAEKYREQFVKLEAIDRRSLTDRSAQEDALTGLPMVRTTVARTFFGAAQIYEVHQQPAKAAELFRKAASLDADGAVYRMALESHYVRRNELAEGVVAFEQLTSEQPGNGLNYYFLGRLRVRLEHVEQAALDFRKVQELTPQWPEGYRALAELDLRSNRQPAEALNLARRVVEMDPSGANYFLLSIACLKNSDRPSALEAVKKAVALAPEEKRYLELLQQLNRAP